MATIDAQVTSVMNAFGKVLKHSWTGLSNGDDGSQVALPAFSDRSVQVTGIFGAGGSVAIEGSIDGENWAVLTDPQGNSLNITSPKIEAVSELVLMLRPNVTAGDGTTDINVHLIAKG